MDIYLKRRRGKILLLIAAITIGVASLLYTNWLTKKMARQERNKVELWAEATRQIISFKNSNTEYINFLLEVIQQNTTIPIIVLDADGSINSDANIHYNEARKDEVLQKELKKMKERVEPIHIDLGENEHQLLYYRESSILRNLRLYPIIQLIVIMVFIVVAYFAFLATNRAEQNQVWVGMSKETAHQLGTPISSLMAWIELLKLKDVDEDLVQELERDTSRLERITERFSKIGSKPELLRINVVEVINSALSYLKTRSSNKVKFIANYEESASIEVPLNAALFSWVIENLCKNAIDAMVNEGSITVAITEKEKNVTIDVTDSGCGVPKSNHKTIFQPGFSTKKRGWGLGLSLAKRIVEIYHSGKIFIKWSEVGKGTTFRIILNK
ncbi:HAMP domain-containing histidine kinase [Maribellus sp. CM-23]|uniref:sensor histidine kinase n=1 Tax=Maribellus sp. CM-23 TaxID=2781026 RepID=UPI001F3C09D9|nr:HAMP domain-containing sensor histidine kinase [Maribellus sp. CM-23]MCE4566670.1 HAMP domain-containing histidine kinase [Maribellus sp. CM-23]